MADRYHGRGELIMKTMYKGQDGKPLMKVFEGFFVEGLTPKEGKITYSDGTRGIYFGEHNDEFEKHGYGYLYSNCMDGKTSVSHPDKAGYIYEGFFSEDQKQGLGYLLSVKTGDYYIGGWESDRQAGPGR